MNLNRSRANETGHKVPLTIATALFSAVLEWMLMFMIFVDASFAYLITRFARCYQLQIPCLFCSRLDHVLGNDRGGFYWDLICHRHRSKISSLVLCRLHNNLVDAHSTCESCLFSSANVNKSGDEIYGLLVGKLGPQPLNGLAQDSLSDKHSTGSRKCSCCNEQWISGAHIQKLIQRKLNDIEGAEHDWSSEYNEVRKITEESPRLGKMGKKDPDPRPHVEYSQIRVTSDTESEGPLSENESVNAIIHEMETSCQESVTDCVSEEPQIVTLADCPASEKFIDLASPIKIPIAESEDRTYSHQNVESEAPLGLRLEGINWQQVDRNGGVSEPSKLVSAHDDVRPSPNADGTRCIELRETDATSTSEMEKEVPIEASKLESDSTGIADLSTEDNLECQETPNVGSESVPTNKILMDSKSNKTDASPQMTESLDLGDAYKLALGMRGRQLSGRLLEQQRSMTDSTRASEDLKLLLSQITAPRGVDLPLNDMSPKLSAHSEDFKAMDPSSAIGMQILKRRISLERNESNLSLDGSTVSEIEGESEVDRLKRQVEHDKKILSTLYKELEEERSASAIAANQAMAMITRLQEEKAAFHMEALQCLRMMDEQTEYDSEALQKANELLAEKERQIQDFESAIELYKNQFGDVTPSDGFVKPRPESENDEIKEQIQQADSKGISFSRFEDEKKYILECLEKLEEKLSMLTKHQLYPDQDFMGISQENGETEEGHLQRDTVVLKETPRELCGDENSRRENKEYGGNLSSNDGELAALREELSIMNSRLGALEAEQNVIECSINALEREGEGFQFIREMTVRLQDLHSAHVIRRK